MRHNVNGVQSWRAVPTNVDHAFGNVEFEQILVLRHATIDGMDGGVICDVVVS
jgi:hypothetical protein